MAHWKKAFPGKFLQVSDLEKPIVATIARVTHETIGSGDNAELKMVVRFREPTVKGCVLNLSRAESIEAIVGDPDTDRWPGHKVKLLKGSTRYQGKKVACITIEAPDNIDDAMPSREEEASSF